MQRIFLQHGHEITFFFRQSVDDFIVTERNKPFAEKGNYLICEVQKKNMTTLEMLRIFEDETGCRNIGYAGLKDKRATTTQYLSFPISFSKELKAFHHPRITILKTFVHNEKISLGDLEGNHFSIRLKQVDAAIAKELEGIIEQVRRQGMPNYFGYQRFGKDSGNFKQCQEVAYGELHMKDKKMLKLLTSAYQSYLFNDWLAKRIELSQDINEKNSDFLETKYHFSRELIQMLKEQPFGFKVLPGDILLDTQTEKWITVKELKEVRKGLKEQKLLPTGLIAGKKAWRAKEEASVFEEAFDDHAVDAKGERRVAWIYPKEIRYKFLEKEGFFELSFFLPKGAYATVFLENLANKNFH